MNISFEVIAVLGLATAMVALVYTYTQNARLRGRLLEQDAVIQAIQADVSAICTGAVGLGEHMAHLEQRATQLDRRQEKIELQGGSVQNYHVAKNLLRKGARVEEVMADCGMSRGEAELVALAQRIRKAS
jgi:hypothetical protein